MSIQELVERGDHNGAVELGLQEHGPELFGYLVTLLRSEADACDVYQDFCIKLLESMKSFQFRCSFRTWAYRLAHNEAMSFLRGPEMWRKTRLGTRDAAELQAASVRSRTTIRTEHRDAFQRLKERLQPQEQAILTLRVDRKMPYREIVEILTEETGQPMSISNARQIHSRTVRRLKRWAADEGLRPGRNR